VLVPLLATLVTFNLVQVWMVFGNGGDAGFLQGALIPAWESGRWVSHLWFLGVLAAYFVIVAVFARPLRVFVESANVQAWLSERWMLTLVLVLAVATPVTVAVLAELVGPAMTEVVLGTASVAEALRFLPAFSIGMLLLTAPALLDRFARFDERTVLLGVSAVVGMQLAGDRPEISYRVIDLLAAELLCWMAVRALFALFRNWVNRPSAVFTYLSSASYSIYLFHHLAVIATATALMPLALGAGGKAIIVLAVASMVPLALHHFLVRKYAVIGYLFNGRTTPGKVVLVPAPVAARAAPGT
jgi:glucan biosynthesis protein C